MIFPQDEFEAILNDLSKKIDGNIEWKHDEQHPFWVGFRAEIISDENYPLFVKGSYNSTIDALSYVIIHRTVGRIYGLDLGKDHANPDGTRVGEKHKHRWDEVVRDKAAYVPQDITAPASQPLKVWQQFCLEAKIVHNGVMSEPPARQLDLFI